MWKMECQLCEEEHRRAESKFTLCPDCATGTMIREARKLRIDLSLAKANGLPATFTLQQRITVLDYFAWNAPITWSSRLRSWSTLSQFL
jgi:hypothetical protein